MLKIRNFQIVDFPVVKQIYQEGIDTGHATFQEKAKEWEDWDKSVLSVCRLVAEENNSVVGWAALSSVSDRCVYGGVSEVSVYVANASQGKGIGYKLLSNLVEESELNNMWTLQAGIFPENKASIRLHEKCGFRIVGTRQKLGKMKDQWRDVILMERRSTITGI